METLTGLWVAPIAIVLGVFIHYSFKPKTLPFIPHNSPLPWMGGDNEFFGKAFTESGRFTRANEIMSQRFGPVSQLVLGPGRSWLGRWFDFGTVLVTLSDSQEIHDILVNRASEFERSRYTIYAFYATIPTGMISLPTKGGFKHHKRWLGPSMTAPYLARMIPRMTTSIMEMLKLWSLSSDRLRFGQDGSEKAFSAMDDIRLASIDVIASITFGTSFNSIRAAIDLLESDPRAGPSTRPPTPALARALEQLLDTIGDNLVFPFPALLTWWTRTFNHKWKKARKVLYEFLEATLDTARESYETTGENERRPDARLADNVLDMILEREREDHLKGEKPLNRSEILDELATYAIAGSETTATSMQWAIKLLARHPHVQHKLHREVVDKLPAPGQRVATFEEFSSTERLPYLSAVVYEVLRVSGTVAAVVRDTTRDTTILGYPVPKGVPVIMLTSYAQRSESESYKAVSEGIEGTRHESSRRNGRKYGYWADDDHAEFKPERWLTTDGVFNPTAGPWIPFSLGFRGCFGQKLAILELRMFLALIQATFFLDKVPEELDSFAARETITTHPTQCYVNPIPWSEIGSEI